MRQIALAALIALSACSLVPGNPAYQEREARAALAATLFDAETARFRNVASVTVKGERTICGHVNARNRMGAYVGFRRFVVSPDTTFAVVSPDAGPNADDETHADQAGFDAVWKDCPAKAGR